MFIVLCVYIVNVDKIWGIGSCIKVKNVMLLSSDINIKYINVNCFNVCNVIVCDYSIFYGVIFRFK